MTEKVLQDIYEPHHERLNHEVELCCPIQITERCITS